MLMTVEEFLVAQVPDGKVELVRGELRVTLPPGAPHGFAESNLFMLLGVHVKANGLGRVFGDSFGYILTQLPRTVRVPDVSFVRAGGSVSSHRHDHEQGTSRARAAGVRYA
jgi:Uma2 family endonuclease